MASDLPFNSTRPSGKRGLRPGFLLMETVLWTTITGVGLFFIVQLLEIQSEQNRVQEEARILSDLADTAAREALTGLVGEITATRAAGGARTIVITDLSEFEVEPASPRNRDLHLVHYAPNTTSLWLLAYTTGADAGTPRSSPGITNIGVIDHDGPCSTTTVCGPGLRWTHTPLTPLLAIPPAEGSMVALRYLDATPGGDPFVWQVDTGDATRTTMTSNLDLDGHDLANVGQVSAGNIDVQTTLEVMGDAEAGELDASVASSSVGVTGVLVLDGTFTAATMNSSLLDLAGNDITVVNDIDGNRIEATGTITITGDLEVTTGLATEKITGNLTTDTLSVVTLEATSTTVGGSVVVNRATTGNLDLDPGQLTVEGILYTARCTGTGCTSPP